MIIQTILFRPAAEFYEQIFFKLNEIKRENINLLSKVR